MKRYVEYEVEGGKSIIIEVEDAAPGLVPATSAGEVVAKSEQRFEQALEAVGPIAEKILAKLSDITRVPDQIDVEFGLKLGMKAGAVVASGSTEANLKVSLSWKRRSVSQEAVQE